MASLRDEDDITDLLNVGRRGPTGSDREHLVERHKQVGVAEGPATQVVSSVGRELPAVGETTL